MAAEPKSFYAWTKAGGILRLHDKTPPDIRGLATIGLETCMGLIIIGINEQVSLLHTPRRGIHWPSIDKEVSHIGCIKEVYIAYNPLYQQDTDRGYLDLLNHFSKMGATVHPFPAPALALTGGGKIAYNRHTKKLGILDSEDLISENPQLYCHIFSLNTYFESTVELYLHYDGSQWNKTIPTLFPYPLKICALKKEILNENREENIKEIKNTILRDMQYNPGEVPPFFSDIVNKALKGNNKILIEQFKDIAEGLFTYAEETAKIAQQISAPTASNNPFVFQPQPSINQQRDSAPILVEKGQISTPRI